MKALSRLRFSAFLLLLLGAWPTFPTSAYAQAEVVLPRPTEPFKGKIGKTFATSVQDFPQPIRAPKGAPNVVIILLGDVGFGHPGTFGGPIPTPN
jgi:arylsulfatase